jgi:hypothetical protein
VTTNRAASALARKAGLASWILAVLLSIAGASSSCVPNAIARVGGTRPTASRESWLLANPFLDAGVQAIAPTTIQIESATRPGRDQPVRVRLRCRIVV